MHYLKRAIFTFYFLSNYAYSAQIVNMGLDFQHDLDGWRVLSIEQRNNQLDLFESRYQSIYDVAVYGKGEGDWVARKNKKRTYFFQELPKSEEGMKQLFDSAENVVIEQEIKFRKLFPNFREDIPVVIMPSIFTFNGQVRYLDQYKMYGLLIGVDVLVARQDNLNVLFSHEFFHAYHRSARSDNEESTMAAPIWKEGFATYVSKILNPEADLSTILLDKELAIQCDTDNVKRWSKKYLEIVDTDGELTYRDWFTMNGKVKPYRRGYCLGLKVIEMMMNQYSLETLIGWSEKEYGNKVKLILKELSLE